MADLLGELNKLEADDKDYKHALDHAEQQGVTCPKCNNFFLPKLQSLTIPDINSRMVINAEAIVTKRKRVDELRTYLDDFKIFSGYLNRMQSIFASYPTLRVYWDEVIKVWKQTQTPAVIVSLFPKWRIDLEKSIQYKLLKEEYDRENATYKSLIANNASSIKQIKDRAGELDRLISNTITKLEELRFSLKVGQNFIKLHRKLKDDTQRLGLMYAESVQLCNNYIKASKNKFLYDRISARQVDLARAEHVFTAADTAVKTIEDLTKRKEEATTDLEAYIVLVKELSPNEGLIADHVNMFMSFFLENINKIIADIWTYELEVLPCSMEKGELNYKFPFSVRMNPRPVPDVQHGSSSQLDIFNFAFKIVAVMLLELDSYPLYLDELAPTLDERHRLNIIIYVKEFMEMKSAVQLFMISHYAAMHGALSHAQFCVLEDSNIITLPEEYNKHVIIKRG